MAYSKVELKSNNDKVSSCVKRFLTGNVSDVDYLDSIIGFAETYYISIYIYIYIYIYSAGHVIEILCMASEWKMRIG